MAQRSARKSAKRIPVIREERSSLSAPMDQLFKRDKANPPTKFDRVKKRRLPAKYIVLIIFTLIVAATVVGFYVFQWGGSQFSGDLVTVEFDAATQVSSGDTITIKINYKNDETVPLGNASLITHFPEGFTVRQSSIEPDNSAGNSWSLGTLSRGKSGSLTVTGQLVGAVNDQKTFSAKLVYKPASFNATFETSTDLVVTITSSIIDLSLDGPIRAAPGGEASYTLTYTSMTSEILENIVITPEWPDSFTLKESVPELTENRNWSISRLTNNESGNITFSGTFDGEIGDSAELVFTLGLIDADGFQKEQLKYTQLILLVGGELSLDFKVNDADTDLIVEHGDTLTYELNYANTTEFVLEDVSLSVTFEEAVLAWDELVDSSGGSLAEKAITWNKDAVSSLAALKPGASGSIRFSIPIRDNLTIDTDEDINFSIVSVARGSIGTVKDSAGLNIAVPTKTIEAKIATKFVLEAEARYYSTERTKLGSGPLPPVVGKTTTYRVFLYLSNSTNDIRDVTVTTELPKGASWQNESTVTAGNLTYNNANKTVSWTINEVPAGSGNYLSSLTASFDVAITPTTNDIGEVMLLTGALEARATDSYTQSEVEDTVSKITTDLTNDTFALDNGVVESD
ncbi:MAG: hypothetical protein V1838_02140 [Patescibacteria group bacterium]